MSGKTVRDEDLCVIPLSPRGRQRTMQKPARRCPRKVRRQPIHDQIEQSTMAPLRCKFLEEASTRAPADLPQAVSAETTALLPRRSLEPERTLDHLGSVVPHPYYRTGDVP